MKKLLFLIASVFVSMATWAQDTNVAQGATVTSSGLGNPDAEAISKIVDGNKGTAYGDGIQYGENTEWTLIFDLGEEKTINGFSISFSNNVKPTKFNLYSGTKSDDEYSWTPIGSEYETGYVDGTENVQTFVRTFDEPVTTRYVEYVCKKENTTNSTWGYNISEFELISYATGADAPPTHTNMFEEIYTKNNPSPVWQLAWNGNATKDGEATYAGTPVTSFSAVKAIHFGKTGDQQDFSANAALYDQLSMDIYVETATNDLTLNLNNSGYVKNLELAAGWNTVTADVSDITAANLKVLSLRHKDGASAETGLTLKLANIYFSQVTVDESDYEIATLESDVAYVKKGEETAITLTPKNAKGAALTTYGDDKVTVTYTVSEGGTLDSETNPTTITITGDEAVTITATAKTDNSETTASTTVKLYPAAPADPTESETNVLALYSDKYGKTTFTKATSGWGNPNCTYSSADATALADGNYSLFVKGDGLGLEVNVENPKDYAKVSFDIYPAKAVTNGKIFLEQGTLSIGSFTAKANQWTTVSLWIPSNEQTAGKYLFISLGVENTMDFFLDNIYLIKEASSLEVTFDETTGEAKVLGPVTEDDLDQLNTTAQVLDLTGVTSWTATSAIQTTNPNTLIVVPGTRTQGEGATFTPDFTIANTQNVVGKTSTENYHFPLTPIVYEDNDEYQPWTGTLNSIPMYGSTVTIQRTITTGKYVTTCLPIAFTISEGLTVYALDAENSTASEVKFKQITEGIAAHTPYVVYAEDGATLTATQNAGDFALENYDTNLTEGAIEFGEEGHKALFIGNYKQKAGTGEEYGLQNATDGVTLRPVGTGAKIGAFRAYFTGLEPATGDGNIKVHFFNEDDIEEATGILNVATGEVEVDGAWYTLSGVRVAQPAKGLYIHNGKKVLVK